MTGERVFTSTFSSFEMRAVAYDFPQGSVQGFEFRFLLMLPATQTEPARSGWGPWTFGSRESVHDLIRQMQTYVADAEATIARSAQ